VERRGTIARSRKPEMITCLILADDLSGAADSAVSALDAGLDAEVFLSPESLPQARTSVVALDLNTRQTTREQARIATLKGLSVARPGPSLFLYKKVDSTLRGNVAVELAATLTGAGKRFILFAPAFPTNGRITIGGRIFVDGELLELTEFWSARHGQEDFANQMTNAGLKFGLLPLETVRRGKQEIHRTVSDLVADGRVTILCDAERDADLFEIAKAGFEFGPQCLFAGSGGLARQLFKLFGPGDLTIPVPPKLRERTLVVVGTLAKNAQAQFAELRNIGTLSSFSVGSLELKTPTVLHNEFQRALDAGEDLAVGLNANALTDHEQATELLAELVGPVLASVGALIVTGGETCRSLLDRLGASRLHLLQELTPGVALALVANPHPLLLVVKAGGFGGPHALRDAYDFLKKVRR
jgi:D-threonate/D-erythronate kinase